MTDNQLLLAALASFALAVLSISLEEITRVSALLIPTIAFAAGSMGFYLGWQRRKGFGSPAWAWFGFLLVLSLLLFVRGLL